LGWRFIHHKSQKGVKRRRREVRRRKKERKCKKGKRGEGSAEVQLIKIIGSQA
jgi:hypothetical protein